MSQPSALPLMTVDEYLAFERAAEERHVYIDGEIFAMAGESLAHGYISTNLVISLGLSLKGTSCSIHVKDMKVRSGPIPESGRGTRGMFSYPDVVAICGEAECHDSFQDIVLNPTAIFEILSPSNEAFDRGDKFIRYREWNPSLKDYVLISQNRPIVEKFCLRPNGIWEFEEYVGLEAVASIKSLRCELKLADLYDRVTFPTPG